VRVIILAAGMATRFRQQPRGHTSLVAGEFTALVDELDTCGHKCLISIGDRPLIAWTVDRLQKKGFDDIYVVTGHNHHRIYATIGPRVQYVYNPFFRATNSLGSLWFARDKIPRGGGTVILNADVFFEDRLLDVIVEERNSPVLFADRSRTDVADYRFRLEGELITAYGKADAIPDGTVDAEYIGVGYVAAAHTMGFRTRVEDLVERQGAYDRWWEDALYSWVAEKRPVYCRDVSDSKIFWGEVDNAEDVKTIRQWVSAHPHVP